MYFISKTPSRCPTATAHAVSVGHFNGVARREYNHLVTCWEAIRPAVIGFPRAWAARAQDDATCAGGCHGDHQNARCELVESTFFIFFIRVLAH